MIIRGSVFHKNRDIPILFIAKEIQDKYNGKSTFKFNRPPFYIKIPEDILKTLTSIDIPDSVLKIEPDAFAGSSLRRITIPSSVDEIGHFAFYCSKLTSLNIPASVEKIGNRAFAGCTFLTELTIAGVKIKGGLLESFIEPSPTILSNYYDALRVLKSPLSELPLLMGDDLDDLGQLTLEARLKGGL